jgi:DUF4097 and DUF4098 domain-containing protein YvlB
MTRWDYPVSDPVDVRVSVSSGQVAVTAAAAGAISVTARTSSGDDQVAPDDLVVRFAGGGLEVTQPKSSGWWRRRVGVDVAITVPPGSRLTARTADADVSCRGELSALEVKTASGDVAAQDVTGPVSAVTASGDVRLDSVRATARVSTASGDVTVVTADGEVTCTTASGEIDVGAASGSLRANTASGDIRIGSVRSGETTAVSVSGDLDVGVAPGVDVYLDLSSLSGRVSSELEPSDQGGAAELRLSCRSLSGSVLVRRATATASHLTDLRGRQS